MTRILHSCRLWQELDKGFNVNVYDTSFVISPHAQEPRNEDSVMHKTFFLGAYSSRRFYVSSRLLDFWGREKLHPPSISSLIPRLSFFFIYLFFFEERA